MSIETRPPTEAQQEIITRFTDIEKNQLEFIEQAGKRVVEMTTVLLGLLLAAMSFGDTFPPPYLKDNGLTKGLLLIALALYVGAMFFGVWTVQPRLYRFHPHRLDKLPAELDAVLTRKAWTMRLATILFFLASLCLALLIDAIALSA